MRVLLVEDEERLASTIARGLRNEGMAVDVVLDGKAALSKTALNNYDVVVLDRNLPLVHGDDVCRELVARQSLARILMLTAAGSVQDRVTGLDLGADDYLPKPFALKELVARIRALGRRAVTPVPPVLAAGDLVLDPARHVAERNGRDLGLTKKEFGVLEVLLAAEGRVVSAEELLEKVWDENTDPFTNVVRVSDGARWQLVDTPEAWRGLASVVRRAERIAVDRAAGFTPFFICGNAGTTNTGAVDDLDALADLAARERLWMHVDAAYGGFFLLTERGRKAMGGVGRADSVVLDPHKGLFLPYGAGALLVRDAQSLRRAHAAGADYLPHMQEEPGFVDTCEISPELSRSFRGLKVWLPLKLHGLGAFRRSLDEKLDLALHATRELAAMPGIEIVAGPQLSIVAFRLVREGLDEEALNGLNRGLLERVNARQRVHLSGTVLRGAFVLRICVLSFRTHLERLDEGLDDLRAAIAES